MQIVGHSSVTTTEVYAKFDENILEDVLADRDA
jgi:site-specific recombinase XerD